MRLLQSKSNYFSEMRQTAAPATARSVRQTIRSRSPKRCWGATVANRVVAPGSFLTMAKRMDGESQDRFLGNLMPLEMGAGRERSEDLFSLQ